MFFIKGSGFLHEHGHKEALEHGFLHESGRKQTHTLGTWMGLFSTWVQARHSMKRHAVFANVVPLHQCSGHKAFLDSYEFTMDKGPKADSESPRDYVKQLALASQTQREFGRNGLSNALARKEGPRLPFVANECFFLMNSTDFLSSQVHTMIECAQVAGWTTFLLQFQDADRLPIRLREFVRCGRNMGQIRAKPY